MVVRIVSSVFSGLGASQGHSEGRFKKIGIALAALAAGAATYKICTRKRSGAVRGEVIDPNQPALPTIHSLRPGDQIRYPNDPQLESFSTARIPNQGNTCFAASILQAWILVHSEAIQSKKVEWEERGDHDKRDIANALITLIEKYRAAAAESLGKQSEDGSMDSKKRVDILPMMLEILGKLDWQMAEELPGYLEKQTRWEQEVADLRTALDAAPSCGEEELQMKQICLDSLLLNHPRFSQRDVDQMVICLHDFLYEDCPSTYQKAVLFLYPEEGEEVLDDSMQPLATVNQYHCRLETYTGRTQIPVPWKEEGGRFIVDVRNNSFPKLFQKAFFGDQEPSKRFVKEKDGKIVEKLVRVISRRDYLSTAPQQLSLTTMRFRYSKGASHRIQGDLRDIKERLEVPGDYFIDGLPATYTLESMIVHEGGSDANSGHYVAIVKKTNPKTRERDFYRASDADICLISPEDALKCAEQSYMLFFKKMESESI